MKNYFLQVSRGCRLAAILLSCLYCALQPNVASAADGVSNGEWATYLEGFHDIRHWRLTPDSAVAASVGREWNAETYDKERVEQARIAYMKAWFYGNVKNTHKRIPEAQVRAYVLRGYEQENVPSKGSGTEGSEKKYEYCYGGKARLDDGDWVCFVYREEPSCVLPLGRGAVEVFLIGYSPDGRIKGKSLVAVERYGHAAPLTFNEQYFSYDLRCDTLGYRGLDADTVACRNMKNGACVELRVMVHGQKLLYDSRDGRLYGMPLNSWLKINGDYTAEIKSAYIYCTESYYVHRGKAREYNRRLFGRHVDGVDLDELDDAYHSLMKSPKDSLRQRRFFNAFPSTWAALADTYGYRLDKRFDLHMFCEWNAQAKAFADIAGSVAPAEYCRKVIGFCMGGNDRGPVLLVQGEVHDLVCFKLLKRWPSVFFAELEKMTVREQLEFWKGVISSSYEGDVGGVMAALSETYTSRFPRVFNVFRTAMEYYCNSRYERMPREY